MRLFNKVLPTLFLAELGWGVPSLLPKSLYAPYWEEVVACNTLQEHYTCTHQGIVTCNPGWDWFQCQGAMCAYLFDPSEWCSVPQCPGCPAANGDCLRPFQCQCKYPYTGSNCTQINKPDECLYGFAKSPEELCVCDVGWSGPWCDTPLCDAACSTPRGVCREPGICQCQMGWMGENCRECVKYPGCEHGSCEACDENGHCNKPWSCVCDQGWEGSLCNIKIGGVVTASVQNIINSDDSTTEKLYNANINHDEYSQEGTSHVSKREDEYSQEGANTNPEYGAHYGNINITENVDDYTQDRTYVVTEHDYKYGQKGTNNISEPLTDSGQNNITEYYDGYSQGKTYNFSNNYDEYSQEGTNNNSENGLVIGSNNVKENFDDSSQAGVSDDANIYDKFGLKGTNADSEHGADYGKNVVTETYHEYSHDKKR